MMCDGYVKIVYLLHITSGIDCEMRKRRDNALNIDYTARRLHVDVDNHFR